MLIMLAALAPAPAEQVPPALVEAVTGWSMCRGTYLSGRIESDVSAVALAEQAFAACSDHERRAGAIMQEAGGRWAEAAAPQRARFFADTVRAVEESRGGRHGPANVTQAWGICVGEAVQTDGQGAPEAVADRAFASCRALEQAVLTHLRPRYGDASAQTLNAMKGQVRTQILRQLAAAPASGGGR